MQQLTGLDASFLVLETGSTTGHVGGLSVLDPRDAPKPLTLTRLTDVLAERIPLVPVLRRKLLNVPLGLDQPYWVDDPDFDMMAGIDVPVLLIGGEDDRLVSAAAMRQASARFPRWESVILAGVGHTPMLEVPGAVTDAITDWLDRHFTP